MLFPLKREVPEGWEVGSILDVSELKVGGTPSKKQVSYWNGNIPWVKTAQIQNGHISKDQIDEYITELGVKESSAKIVPKGTLLMAMYGQGKTRGHAGKNESVRTRYVCSYWSRKNSV